MQQPLLSSLLRIESHLNNRLKMIGMPASIVHLTLFLQMPHSVSRLVPYLPCSLARQSRVVVTQLRAFLSQPEDLFASKLLKRAHPADRPDLPS